MTRLFTFYWSDDGVYLVYLIMAFVVGYKYSIGKGFAMFITKVARSLVAFIKNVLLAKRNLIAVDRIT